MELALNPDELAERGVDAAPASPDPAQPGPTDDAEPAHDLNEWSGDEWSDEDDVADTVDDGDADYAGEPVMLTLEEPPAQADDDVAAAEADPWGQQAEPAAVDREDATDSAASPTTDAADEQTPAPAPPEDRPDEGPGPLQAYASAMQAFTAAAEGEGTITVTPEALMSLAAAVAGELARDSRAAKAREAVLEARLDGLESRMSQATEVVVRPNITVESVTCRTEVPMPAPRPASPEPAPAPAPAPAPEPEPEPSHDQPAPAKRRALTPRAKSGALVVALGVVIGLALVLAVAAIASMATGTPLPALVGMK